MESFIRERKLQAANALSAAINAQRKITIASALYLPTTISSFLRCTLALSVREGFLLLLIFHGLQRDSCSFIAIGYLSALPELFTNPFCPSNDKHRSRIVAEIERIHKVPAGQSRVFPFNNKLRERHVLGARAATELREKSR